MDLIVTGEQQLNIPPDIKYYTERDRANNWQFIWNIVATNRFNSKYLLDYNYASLDLVELTLNHISMIQGTYNFDIIIIYGSITFIFGNIYLASIQLVQLYHRYLD